MHTCVFHKNALYMPMLLTQIWFTTLTCSSYETCMSYTYKYNIRINGCYKCSNWGDLYVLMFSSDGIVLVRKCYITCVNLLFSNSRVQSYIKKGRLLDLRTDVQTVPPDEDVGHVGNAQVRRRWVQLRT